MVRRTAIEKDMFKLIKQLQAGYLDHVLRGKKVNPSTDHLEEDQGQERNGLAASPI